MGGRRRSGVRWSSAGGTPPPRRARRRRGAANAWRCGKGGRVKVRTSAPASAATSARPAATNSGIELGNRDARRREREAENDHGDQAEPEAAPGARGLGQVRAHVARPMSPSVRGPLIASEPIAVADPDPVDALVDLVEMAVRRVLEIDRQAAMRVRRKPTSAGTWNSSGEPSALRRDRRGCDGRRARPRRDRARRTGRTAGRSASVRRDRHGWCRCVLIVPPIAGRRRPSRNGIDGSRISSALKSAPLRSARNPDHRSGTSWLSTPSFNSRKRYCADAGGAAEIAATPATTSKAARRRTIRLRALHDKMTNPQTHVRLLIAPRRTGGQRQ